MVFQKCFSSLQIRVVYIIKLSDNFDIKITPAGAQDHKHCADRHLLTYAMEEFAYDCNLFVNDDFQRYADATCIDFGKPYPPTTYEEALELFFLLLQDCNNNMLS